ncbi:MAG: hypothetical protein PHO26_05440 [Dehalococcoidia bacterium]|nr:hypothetical protein [Dehalococcoidia bacterium]MDD5493140.1 hypothetical protein [Dehalococcoidia bacterium]
MSEEKGSLPYLISSDLSRFAQTYALRGQKYSRVKIFFESFIFKAGFQAVFLYRLSHWFFKRHCIYLAWFFSRLNQSVTGAEIEFNAEIGPALFIAHPSGIVVGRGTVMGSNITIFQGVTFATRSWHPDDINRFPVVGDGCYFFAHCTVIGNVKIGNNCVVGAQALVSKDMPDGSLAVGTTADIIPGKGKELGGSWVENL